MKLRKGQLTARQKLFCEMYVGPGRHCAALAARLAGYAPGCSHVTGCQLLKKPKIAATVRGLEDALARQIDTSRLGIMKGLEEAVELARSLKEPSAMTAALRQIGLMAGYYRLEEGVGRPKPDAGQEWVRMQSMTDDELACIVEAGALHSA